VPKSLAEIVLDDALATAEIVAAAAEVSDRTRVPLIAALIRETRLDEVAVVAALRRHLRIPLLEADSVTSEAEALRTLPHEVCRRLRVLPLSVADYDAGARLLRVAMADPTDHIALAEVEHHSACRVEPSLLTLSAIEELVETTYRRFVTQVMPRGQGAAALPAAPGTPSTHPYHRVTDDAELAVRHRALVNLLLEKRLITDDEYEEHVRQLMKQDQEPEPEPAS
jgi:hypothetical protein